MSADSSAQVQPSFDRSLVSDEAFDGAWLTAEACCERAIAIEDAHDDPGAALRAMVGEYGARGLLQLVAPSSPHGALGICLARERLGFASPLAELAFAMQGLGSHPLSLAGGDQATRWRDRAIAGDAVAAFALTERDAGSDLQGIATRAVEDADGYRLSGEKVTISNAPVADFFVVFAKTDPEAPASRQLSAFIVPAALEGVSTTPTSVLGGHPIGSVAFDDVSLGPDHLLGERGRGLGLALATLHRFRPTVGGAAVGFASRALAESIHHVKTREQFGAPLAELPLVQARIAEMACELDGARLLVHRAAASIDADEPRGEVARKGSMAKLVATEAAQRVIDTAVQLHGGLGVTHGTVVCRLYEEVRALRIYEGTNDVQKLLIARELLR